MCKNDCRDVHALCPECRAEFETLLDELHQEEPRRCPCALPWAVEPCPNPANPDDPDGYCEECRGVVVAADAWEPTEEGGAYA